MIRKNIIKTKLKEIEESLKLVEENLPEEFDEFANMGLMKDGIYKRIEFCIQNALDICSIINSDLELGIPSCEDSIVENLMRAKILGAELGGKIKLMKGFRNILVHKYGYIKDELAFDWIRDNLRNFRLFMKGIEKFLASMKAENL